MQIHVYDTYVKAKDGHTMHFDVFTAVKDDQKLLNMQSNGFLQSAKGTQWSPVKNVVSVIARAHLQM